MQPFVTLESVAAPLPIMNVDTDMIIPKQFLKTIKRTGLGTHLFDEMRYTTDGTVIDDFILNRSPYDKAQILVSGANFGCGSSREHAPWALLDFGIRCVIAPSFADIFYNNCFKNGILPIHLPQEQVDRLMQMAQSEGVLRIDLNAQQITSLPAGSTPPLSFEIDPFRKQCLVEGLDDIALTLAKEGHISDYEKDYQTRWPWLMRA